jgi:hypothetical protein
VQRQAEVLQELLLQEQARAGQLLQVLQQVRAGAVQEQPVLLPQRLMTYRIHHKKLRRRELLYHN